jgi:cyanate permease
MTIVVLMLAVLIFSGNTNPPGDFFFRVLAASGIVDATLSISAIIMHNIYIQKHPELAASTNQAAGAKSKNFWKSPLVIMLMIYLGFQLISSLVVGIRGGY